MGKPRDKIKGDVWPRMGRDGERMKQTIRRTINGLTLGTSGAGQHKLSDICGQCGPPETLTDGKQRSLNPWMADQPGLVPPLKDLRASGTSNLPAGHPSGMCTPRPASSTRHSIPQERAPTTIPSGRMVSAVSSPSGAPNRRERASGLTFLDLGRYERVKLNRPKKSAQRAWREFSLLAEWMYSRFFWSVQTKKGCAYPSNQWRHLPKANLTANSSLLPMS